MSQTDPYSTSSSEASLEEQTHEVDPSGETSTAMSSKMDTLLGKLVVERGLATQEEVDRALESAVGTNTAGGSLASQLLASKVVTPSQLDRLKPEIETQKVGQQIPGYQIISKLGAGAMATVYKARQLSLDRMVAIKVLPPSQTDKIEFVERFYAEGKAAAKLNHAHIVQAFDVGKSGEFHYFVMEYVEGHTVYDELVDKGRYEESRAIEIGIEVAKALDHAHIAGFIHRDVKPKNIMITNTGVTKLADMGLARAISDAEAAEAERGKAYGTPYYISPEQIRGEVTVDARADLYGLGATLYHMVTGKVPFEANSPSAVMHKHLKDDLVPPDHVFPDLSTGISEVIEVCMAKERDKRYQSASDLLSDLLLVAQGDAPAQARKLFDISSLSQLEDVSIDESANQVLVKRDPKPDLMQQPVFWVAVAGWVVAALMLFVMLVIQLVG